MRSSPGGIHPRFIVIALIILVGIGVASFYKNSTPIPTVTEVPSAGESEQSDTELAQAVLNRLRQHMQIPDSPEPTVAAIVDVEKLRERNAFYDVAENGDYLVVTTTRAILFDYENSVIRDVVPVQLEAPLPPEVTEEQQ